ncbi:MAG: phosphoribosylformylglycinamidine synthase subunit PurL [Bacteroidales bacterium]|nr:phosphoribosylformylglycinamidine synthase subunit PurL [Bacteroidales bacterium]MDD4684634.1 phosphoribosylformylglycinamidine synthase subunit PurL [Bacteroidales bacterium]
MIKNQSVNVATAKELGLLPEEYEQICSILGRTPNFTELSIYSVMWSEHASYKNSIKQIKTLPREGEQLMVKAGEENAGMVYIGNGIACVFKIESHNHPSAVEPYQGAATGVGGINRDIFTMGARPIAQLNSLRFGDIDNPHTQWLLRGVTKGIGDYGNAFGVPVVAGEVFFDPCYENNPLVNAMSVGIMKKDDLISAIATGKGNPIYIVGSATGKDGIHGTSFASAGITENSADDIPSIQVGDPFQEKLLLEASLELGKSGAIIGMQDMGAAGIICSTSEMSERGLCGMDIHLDRVPLRQKNIEPWEILLSESQERMLVCVKKGQEKIVEDIFAKWDLNCANIGEVTDGDRLNFYWNNELVADVPASTLVLGGGAPQYDRESKEPEYFAETFKFNIDEVEEPDLEECKKIGHFIISHPNIASKRWVYQQYDSMVGTRNMSTNAPSDAAVVNIKGTDTAIAMTTDCNGRYVYSNPEIGTQIAVAEAARNIVCSGGEPLAISNCCNFGDPYNPETFWQFENAIKGMGIACRRFNTPVTGGNVSFYNQSSINGKIESVFPTPVIGMVGVLDKKLHTTLDFKKVGQTIYLLGHVVDDINCSEYLYSYKGIKSSPTPYFDIEEEYNLHHTLNGLILEGLIASAHDVSDGGLFTTLIESSMPNNLGFDILTDSEVRLDSYLFGEAQGRIVVSIDPEKEDAFLDMIRLTGVPCCTIGIVTKGNILIDDEDFGNIKDYKVKYEACFPSRMEK